MGNTAEARYNLDTHRLSICSIQGDLTDYPTHSVAEAEQVIHDQGWSHPERWHRPEQPTAIPDGTFVVDLYPMDGAA